GDRGFEGGDFAFIELGAASKLEPAELPGDFASFANEFLTEDPAGTRVVLVATAECRFAGFPLELKTDTFRFELTSQSPARGLSAYVKDEALHVVTLGDGKPAFLKGDWGGGLTC